MTLEALLAAIPAADQTARAQAEVRWDSIAKPLHALGLLEDAVVRMAGITGTPDVTLGKKAVVVMFSATMAVTSWPVWVTPSSTIPLSAHMTTMALLPMVILGVP